MLSKQKTTVARTKSGSQSRQATSPVTGPPAAAFPTSASQSRSREIQWPVGNPRERLIRQRRRQEQQDSARLSGAIQAQVYTSVRTVRKELEVTPAVPYTSELSLRPSKPEGSKSPQPMWHLNKSQGGPQRTPANRSTPQPADAATDPITPALEQMSFQPKEGSSQDPAVTFSPSPMHQTSLASSPPHPYCTRTSSAAAASPSVISTATTPAVQSTPVDRIKLSTRKQIVTGFEGYPYPDPFQRTLGPPVGELATFEARLQQVCHNQNLSMQQAGDKKSSGKRRSVPATNSVWERLSSCSSSDIDIAGVKRPDSARKKPAEERIQYQERALHDARGLLHALRRQPGAVGRMAMFPASTGTTSRRSSTTSPTPATVHHGRRASIALVQRPPDLVSPPSTTNLSGGGGHVAGQRRPLRRFSSLPIRGAHALPLNPHHDYSMPVSVQSTAIAVSTSPGQNSRP